MPRSRGYIPEFIGLRALINQFIQNYNLPHLRGHMESLFGTRFLTDKTSLRKQRAKAYTLLKSMNREDVTIPKLPDIKEFDIKLGLISPLLLCFGLIRRMSCTINLKAYNNAKYNKYLLRIMILSLYLLRNQDSRRFWSLWKIVLKRSHVYLVYSLQNIDKNLYRKITVRAMAGVLKEVNQLRASLSKDMKYHRVYIPKASSGSFAESDRHTYRPLGVPTLPWRIYTNMLLLPLVLFCPANTAQHGFRPQRGTLTAWTVMFKEVLSSPNIYELDLRQCFPSINLLRLDYILESQYNMPEDIRKLYIELNHTTPEFKGVLRANETQSLLVEAMQENLHKVNLENFRRARGNYTSQDIRAGFAKEVSRLTWSSPTFWSSYMNYGYSYLKYYRSNSARLRSLIYEQGLAKTGIRPEILDSFFTSLDVGNMESFFRKGNKFRKQQYQAKVHLYGLSESAISTLLGPIPAAEDVTLSVEFLKHIGTSQGSPLSPYLSILSLKEIQDHLPEGVKVLQYADDLIFYGPKLKEWLDNMGGTPAPYLRKLGFTLHPEKSGWIKCEGNLVQNHIKFLGMDYDFETNTWRAATRKGSTLEMTKQSLLHAEYDIRMMMQYGWERLRGLALKSSGRNPLSRDFYTYYNNLSIVSFALGKKEFYYHYLYLLALVLKLPKSALYKTLLWSVLGLDLKSAKAFVGLIFDESGANTPDRIYTSLSTGGIGPRPKVLDPLMHTVEQAEYWSRYTTSHLEKLDSVVVEDPHLSPPVKIQQSIGASPDLHSPSTPAYPFEWMLRYFYGITETSGYVSQYRDKYTFINYIQSNFKGLILARLYSGTWSLQNLSQDFAYKPAKYSLGWHLIGIANTFTGTSYACDELIKLSSGKTALRIVRDSTKVETQLRQSRFLKALTYWRLDKYVRTFTGMVEIAFPIASMGRSLPSHFFFDNYRLNPIGDRSVVNFLEPGER
jgi:hypothetical protein